jgi:pilus assembly protein Flp/PilA
MKLANPISVIKDESGATAIEYGLIAGLVSVVCIGALQAVGGTLDQLFDKVDADLQEAIAN